MTTYGDIALCCYVTYCIRLCNVCWRNVFSSASLFLSVS